MKLRKDNITSIIFGDDRLSIVLKNFQMKKIISQENLNSGKIANKNDYHNESKIFMLGFTESSNKTGLY